MISYAFTVPDSSFPRSEAASPARAAREGAAPDEAGSRPSIATPSACPAPLPRGRVSVVNRNAAFGLGALIGAAGALVWDRRSRLRTAPAVPANEESRRELREKVAGSRQAEAPPPAPAAEPPRPPEPPPPAPPPPPEAQPAPAPPEVKAPPPPAAPPPPNEFEAMRRRIHEEGKAAAEEMRRAPDEPS